MTTTEPEVYETVQWNVQYLYEGVWYQHAVGSGPEAVELALKEFRATCPQYQWRAVRECQTYRVEVW